MSLELCDVAPRDGLQSLDVLLPPATRAELAGRLAASGLQRVEVASFVRDDLVPAMAGAEKVVEALPDPGGTTWAGLVLNERGYDRLAASGLREAPRPRRDRDVPAAKRRSPVEDGLARAIAVAERARVEDDASRSPSCAFGCPYEGVVDPGVVQALAARVVARGVDEIVLADTIGVAAPSEVRRLVERCVGDLGAATGVHLHDTRGTALACVLAALEAGATLVDGSVGGVGGCPFAPGAQGNVATEDVVYVLEREGIATGVDLDALIETARWLSGVLDRPVPGRVQRAGRWPA
jgi:hydroxymethylglutaryl-CoA lyase/(R)-citramalyl-CoA lyase